MAVPVSTCGRRQEMAGRDVRGLQRLVLGARLRMLESLAFASAVANSALRRDGNGNPGLDRANSRGRIDLLSAAAIAAGIAEPMMDRPAPSFDWGSGLHRVSLICSTV